MNKKMLPMYLTYFRIVMVLPIILFILQDSTVGYWLASVLLVIAGISDALDGYLARKWFATTTAGALLDLVADKILILSILIVLSYMHTVDPFLVILFVFRDIYVMGLRAIAASKGIILYSIPFTKWKTALQIVGVFMILSSAKIFIYTEQIGYGVLWVCILMSGISAWNYTTYCKKKFKFIEFSD